MALSRRQFVSISGTTLAATALESCFRAIGSRSISKSVGADGLRPERFNTTQFGTPRFGPLQRDPNRILDLPAGLTYRVISQVGDVMESGHRVPNAFDGMGAFAGANGQIILVRNHELLPSSPMGVVSPSPYDGRAKGGTTTLVVSPERSLIRQFPSLSGTCRNCAGGTTPWGTWISCEEDVSTPAANALTNPTNVTQAHGYAFEVPAAEDLSRFSMDAPAPLKAMGRFRREAIAIDPRTGIVYQTEDQEDGLFYRFIPEVPGNLAAGGQLQALHLRDRPQAATQSGMAIGQSFEVDWVPISEPDPSDDTVRLEGQQQGATRFARGEGICYSDGHIYFTCTTGGDVPHGQVWKYSPGFLASAITPSSESSETPPSDTLELIVQPNNRRVLDYPDNLIMAPWGDLLLCEDGLNEQFVIAATPEGSLYPIARNALNNSEFAGICAAPDGQTLFLNIYSPGLTLAIWAEAGWS
ncbi:MAG: alkaline phosphatase PhoX [Elainellaceae cyanobacterium]